MKVSEHTRRASPANPQRFGHSATVSLVTPHLPSSRRNPLKPSRLVAGVSVAPGATEVQVGSVDCVGVEVDVLIDDFDVDSLSDGLDAVLLADILDFDFTLGM